MEAEIAALKEKGTWEIVQRPADVPVIDCRWVYKIKDVPGEVPKIKSRLVARGFTQEYGINYWETYSPVVKCSTMRLLFAIAAQYKWSVEQCDVKNAYVNSPLNEEIYMRQPPGFVEGNQRNMVCKLKKSLYGLKQSGHEWNRVLNDSLVDKLKFNRLVTDPCVYIKRDRKNNPLIIAVYVDDILIMSPEKVMITEFKRELNEQYKIDDMGIVSKIIGIEVKITEQYIELKQSALIEKLLKRHGMGECKIASSPLEERIKLDPCDSKGQDCAKCVKVDASSYRSIIGSLNYIASSTRPDLMFSLSYLSQFNQAPHEEHLLAAKRVLRYLKGTINYAIRYGETSDELTGYVDADWAGCCIDRRSYTGYIMKMSGGSISWESKKQPTVALSSTEAEYMALTQAGKEIEFLKNIMMELKVESLLKLPVRINCDSNGARNLSKNVGYSPRTKHIDVRHHYIRELINRNIAAVDYINTIENPADLLTKALGRIKHLKFIEIVLSIQ